MTGKMIILQIFEKEQTEIAFIHFVIIPKIFTTALRKRTMTTQTN